jgi:hypothetical protein
MTRAQIESALTVAGFNTGEWISPADSFKYILINSDKSFFSDDAAVQYYFSASYDYVLTRHLNGRPELSTELATIPAGYTKVVHNGKWYLIKIEGSGAIDQSSDNAGAYHNITSFESIVGLFKK